MTSEQEQARIIAERIARRVAEKKDAAPSGERAGSVSGNLGSELSAVRAGLDDLRQRLMQIESRLTNDKRDSSASERERREASSDRPSDKAAQKAAHTSLNHPLRLSGIYMPAVTHPSQDRFGVEEATVAELVDFFEGEKKCELEPGGKPCDHCSMCSTRGF